MALIDVSIGKHDGTLQRLAALHFCCTNFKLVRRVDVANQ